MVFLANTCVNAWIVNAWIVASEITPSKKQYVSCLVHLWEI